MMLPTTAGGSSFSVQLPDEAATRRFMRDIALALQPGDLITLSGDLGAGKTTFARALIRHLAGDETIEVPSPTFTLIQTYELAKLPDRPCRPLPRLRSSSELAELGFDDLPEDALVLLEWPDRAAGFLPADRLDIAFTHVAAAWRDLPQCAGDRLRKLRRRAPSAWRRSAPSWTKTDSATPSAAHLQGDASTRSYERLVLNGQGYILMNSPRRPDGPPVRDGKPYSAIAHLAEDVSAFIAMSKGLRDARPVRAGDLFRRQRKGPADPRRPRRGKGGGRRAAGADRRSAMKRRWMLLAALHAQALPPALPIAPRVEYRLPPYDIDAFLIEVELLLDWYLPRMKARCRRQPAPRSSRCGATPCSRCSNRRPPGCCATFIRPTCCGCPSARASRASACSISRTR